MKRQSIMLHQDDLRVLDLLSNEQAGVLFKELRSFMSSGEINNDDVSIRVAAHYFAHRAQKNDCVVYYIILSNEVERFIKIGVSGRLGNRYAKYASHGYTVEEIKTETYGHKREALQRESGLIKQFSHRSYVPLIPFVGRTECFTLDIKDYIYYV